MNLENLERQARLNGDVELLGLVNLARRQESELAKSHDENETLKAEREAMVLQLAARQPLADSFVEKPVAGELPKLLAGVNRALIGLRDGWADKNDANEAIQHIAEVKAALASQPVQQPAATWFDIAKSYNAQPVRLDSCQAMRVVAGGDSIENKHGLFKSPPGTFFTAEQLEQISTGNFKTIPATEFVPAAGVQGDAFPERDQSKPAEQQGVFRKFEVRRVDGSDAPGGKHHGCRYFVLDMDHDQNAAPALAAYAASCAVTHPNLSAELVAEFGQQPAAVVGQEPYGWVCQRIQQNGKVGDYWEYYDAKAASNLMGEAGLRANDSMTNWTPLYTAQVPAAGVQGDALTATRLADAKAEIKYWKEKAVAAGACKPDSGRNAALEAMARAKLLPIWDNINRQLHVELDVIFKYLAAHPAPSSDAAQFVVQRPDGYFHIATGRAVERAEDAKKFSEAEADALAAIFTSEHRENAMTSASKAVRDFKLTQCATVIRVAGHPANGAQAGLSDEPVWTPLTAAGQVKKGDKLRFNIGDKAYSETARQILFAGTDKEEVIYNKYQNFYFITSMAINGSSSHKNVEILAATKKGG